MYSNAMVIIPRTIAAIFQGFFTLNESGLLSILGKWSFFGGL